MAGPARRSRPSRSWTEKPHIGLTRRRSWTGVGPAPVTVGLEIKCVSSVIAIGTTDRVARPGSWMDQAQ